MIALTEERGEDLVDYASFLAWYREMSHGYWSQHTGEEIRVHRLGASASTPPPGMPLAASPSRPSPVPNEPSAGDSQRPLGRSSPALVTSNAPTVGTASADDAFAPPLFGIFSGSNFLYPVQHSEGQTNEDHMAAKDDKAGNRIVMPPVRQRA